MSKKVLSLLLIAAILLTSTLFSGVIASAETVTWAVGDQPYAVPGKSSEIEVYDAASATFYDDFTIPAGFNFEDSNVTDFATLNSKKSIQLNNSNSSSILSNSGTPYVWIDLAKETDGVNENAYGGKGNSIKVTTTYNVGVKNAYDGIYYNAIRRNAISFDCKDFPSFENIAISFWVKTEGESQFSAALWDTSISSGGQKIYTDSIHIAEAGEYIIVVPLSSFHVTSTSYVKNEDISTFQIRNFEIMFKSIGLTDGEKKDIYIDNIGIYAIKPNFKPAYISEIANVKDNFDDYTQTATKTVTSASKAAYVWNTSDGSACSSVDVIDNNGDRSVVYNASNYLVYSSANYNTLQATNNDYILYATDKSGKNYGVDGTLAIYVKASRATSLDVRINNQAMNAWLQSAVHHIPAGESIVRIPLSEFGDNTLTRTRKIIIRFGSTTPVSGTIGGSAGTFEIDDIAFEPTYVEGDVNNDKVADILDAVTHNVGAGFDLYNDSKIDARDEMALRRYLLGVATVAKITPAVITEESFVERSTNINSWRNKTTATTALGYCNDALYYYTGSNDTGALEVKYSSLKAASGNNFYYEGYINTPYASDSVLTFWVYSEQSVNLCFNYRDVTSTPTTNFPEGGEHVQCKTKTVTIPAGESIVEVPMSELVPQAYEMNYVRAYQLQFQIFSNSSSTKTSGTVYIDAIGFYDKDTTNNIPAAE